jgi:4,5:9,10-diseco-3-hydroxy-5,9,17-trioxoandrosta-1(10),2-diene-4-oate hydrolase
VTPRRRERDVDAGGLRIHCSELGEGPPLLMLQGGGPGATGWGNFGWNATVLARDFRVIVPDLPQFGRSDKPIVKGGILEHTAHAMAGFLDGLGVERTHIVGNSQGGGTALHLAIHDPDRVDRLVILGAAGLDGEFLSASPSEGLRLLAGYYPDPSREKMRALLGTLLHDVGILSDQAVEARYQASVEPDALAVFSHPVQPRWEDLYADLHRVASDTLILWGLDDRMTPVEAAFLFLRKIPHARLHVFSACGHSVQLEREHEFNVLVGDFLSGRLTPT